MQLLPRRNAQGALVSLLLALVARLPAPVAASLEFPFGAGPHAGAGPERRQQQASLVQSGMNMYQGAFAAERDQELSKMSTEAELRTQLAGALHMQTVLRRRLADVSREAHLGVARLRVQAETAEAKASFELKQLQARVKVAEHTRDQLREALHAAQTAEEKEKMRVMQSEAEIAQKRQQLLLVQRSLADAEHRQAAIKSEADAAMSKARAQLNASEAELKDQRQQFAAVQQGLTEARSREADLENQANQARKVKDGLQAQFVQLNKRSSEEQSKAQKELHSVMLTAAQKVRELEDKVDALEVDLQKAKSEANEAQAEGAKAKDTLLQETQAALQASQRADALGQQLADAQKAGDKSSQKAAQLAATVSALQADRVQSQSLLSRLTEQASQWHGQVEELQKTAEEERARVSNVTEENKSLRTQVAELSGESQRADALADQLAQLRAAAQSNVSRELALEEQMGRVRELKDHYSSAYEAARNESDTWHAKAEDLDHRFLAAEREETATARERDAAVDRVRAARSEENEYFEENTRLQQQNEALEAKLQEVTVVANQSTDEDQRLRKEVRRLRAESAREQQASHAAWQESERELARMRKDLEMADSEKESAEAELTRTKAVLTDAQRKVLEGAGQGQLGGAKQDEQAAQAGAPKVGAAAAPRRAPSSPPAAAAAVGVAAVPLAAAGAHEGSAAAPTEPPLTPQVGERKVWGALGKLHKHEGHHVAAVLGKARAAVPRAAAAAPLLRGEPRRPGDSNDDPAGMLASVATGAEIAPPAAPSAGTAAVTRSTLQKLAEYFASPISH